MMALAGVTNKILIVAHYPMDLLFFPQLSFWKQSQSTFHIPIELDVHYVFIWEIGS